MTLMLKKPISNNINNVDINFLMRPNSLTTISNKIVRTDLKLLSIDWFRLPSLMKNQTWKAITMFSCMVLIIIRQITSISKCYKFHHRHHSCKIMQSQRNLVECLEEQYPPQQQTIIRPIYCQHLHFINATYMYMRISTENCIMIIESHDINHIFANSPFAIIVFGLKMTPSTVLKTISNPNNPLDIVIHSLRSFSSVIELLLFILLAWWSNTTTMMTRHAGQQQFNDAIKIKKQNESSTNSSLSRNKTSKITTSLSFSATMALVTDQNLRKLCTNACACTETHIHNLLNMSSIRIKRNTSIILLKNRLSFLAITFLMCSPICAITATTHNMKYSSNVVKTKYGELRGIIVRKNPTVEAYLGVPYATPPTGSLRYMPPVTPSAWKITRLADHFSPVCPQSPPVSPTGHEALLDIPRERLAQIRRLLPLLANQSEDCLYLNLYVPQTDEIMIRKGDKALATIVYIHGESYEWNSGNPYDGSILAAHGNVIVVTINFRLGVLGFLKTGAKGSAQGNFGLMDLVAGLHWLRENLPSFNGDPSKLILMGHGSGASLANMLITSPVASDLIRRAILLSGSALSPWAIQKDPLYIKRKVAEHTGCHGDLVEDDLAPCLRTKPLAELLSTSLQMPRFLPGFAPFVDGTVIVGHGPNSNNFMSLPIGSAISSLTSVEMADTTKREILFGITSLESYLDLSAQDLEFGFNETRRDRILRTYVRNNFNYHLNEIYAALKNEYTDWERPPRNPLASRDAALELLSDGHTVAPLVRVAHLHSLRGGVSYFMHFKHQSNERDFPQQSGSVRGEDVPFVLGLPISPLFPHNYTKQDIKISRIMVQYVANFAHTGNPNEMPPTFLHISQTKHNHIAKPNELKLTNLVDAEISFKQKRQMTRVSTRRRYKRNRNYYTNNNSNNNNGEDSVESDEHEIDYNDDESQEEVHDIYDRDRLDDSTKFEQHCPFWDSYDALNQYYLQIGNKVEMKNHYRGHKLSLWLNLIPQLHMPGELSELSMRHHHFPESDAKFYDGVVREQIIEKPKVVKPTVIKIELNSMPTKATVIVSTATTTECPTNTTLSTLAATKPQQNIINTNNVNSNKLENRGFNNMEGFLRHITNGQFHNYSAALAITIGVGCFLLLLNILIFAAIYYQRVKRTLDAKRKEEYIETDIQIPNFIDSHMEKGGVEGAINMAEFSTSVPFGEYNQYVEKIHKRNILSNTCSIEHQCKSVGNDSRFDFMQTQTSKGASGGTPDKSNCISRNSTLTLHPTQYSSSPHIHNSLSDAGSSQSSDLVTYQYHQQNCREYRESHKRKPEQCNQSTQSDEMGMHDIETIANECNTTNDRQLNETTDDNNREKVSSTPSSLRSSISTSNYQGGILRQQVGPTTPSASKKRVQIQEISV